MSGWSPLPSHGFRLESDALDLPEGAFAKTHRRTLEHDGSAVLALTDGPFRPYLYPVWSPQGFAVTSERPADHPHHNSIWIAADHVHAQVPAAGGIESYTYNFYLDETFQGRAPGRLIEEDLEAVAGDGVCRLRQTVLWRGPCEWAAPEGRPVARERREIDVRPGARAHLIDIRSTLEPTTWDLSFGPTRHAWLSFRVAESMRVSRGGVLVDSGGRRGGAAVTGARSRWVDYTGPVGGGRRAGIAVIFREPAWVFATDWGVVTIDPFRDGSTVVRRGERLELGYRLVVHDGDPGDIEALSQAWREEVRS